MNILVSTLNRAVPEASDIARIRHEILVDEPGKTRRRCSGPDQWHALAGASVRTGFPDCRSPSCRHHLTSRLTVSEPVWAGVFCQTGAAR